MPKSQYVDPGKVFEPGYIEFDPIPLCRYNKSLEEEKKNYSKADFLRIYHDMRTIREFETMLNEIKVKSEYNGVKYNNPWPGASFNRSGSFRCRSGVLSRHQRLHIRLTQKPR